MDERATLGGLEPEDDAESSHGFLAVLSSLWGRGLEYGSLRTKAYNVRSNQTSREDSLDQLEEARDVALLHSAWYQQSLRRYHARRVRSRDFQVGDLVLQLRQDARGSHKLTPPWEGPFIIAKIFEARNVQAGQRSRRGLQQRLEHPTAMSLLPLRRF
jgi:hypothetical protein